MIKIAQPQIIFSRIIITDCVISKLNPFDLFHKTQVFYEIKTCFLINQAFCQLSNCFCTDTTTCGHYANTYHVGSFKYKSKLNHDKKLMWVQQFKKQLNSPKPFGLQQVKSTCILAFRRELSISIGVLINQSVFMSNHGTNLNFKLRTRRARYIEPSLVLNELNNTTIRANYEFCLKRTWDFVTRHPYPGGFPLNQRRTCWP